MKKWAALILCILAMFAVAAVAQADVSLEYIEREENPEILLWDSIGFSIHSNEIKEGNIRMIFKEGDEIIQDDLVVCYI